MDISLIHKKVDLSAGEWVDNNPLLPGVRLKVRSLNYRAYKRALDLRMARIGEKLTDQEAAFDFQDQNGDLLAEHILIDWDGVTNSGEALPYDADTAVSVLTADDDFGVGQSYRRGVQWAAREVSVRMATVTEGLVGNSPASSSGRSETARDTKRKPKG